MIELGTASSGNNAYVDYCLVYNHFSSWTPPSSCPSPSSVPTSGSGNNGNVMGYWYQDSVQSSFSHTAAYTYDAVNRLGTAVATGSSTYNLTFGYTGDGSNGQYGNMACVQNANTNGPCPQWSYTASTNQFSSSTGCTYDAAGNLTKDCSTAANHTYQWDAEGRVAVVDPGSSPTWTFTYDAVGDRVQWASSSATYEQVFDPSGGWLGVAGSYDIVRWGNRALVVYTGSGTCFNHVNNLDSTTVMTNQAGSGVQDVLFYPWGQNTWQVWSSCGYNFAGMPYYDSTTNTDITMFRHYSPGLGRWHSPDPMGGDITNPQSLNRYPYVLNNPTTLTDPSGQKTQCPQGASLTNPGQCAGNILAMFGTAMHLCYIGGLCDPTPASYISPTGSDEFDAWNPATGVYWAVFPGSAVTNSSGRTSTSTGSLGFSDALWGEANGTSDELEGTLFSRTQPTSMNTLQALYDTLTGDYVFGPATPSATAQSPGSAGFGLIIPATWAWMPGTVPSLDYFEVKLNGPIQWVQIPGLAP